MTALPFAGDGLRKTRVQFESTHLIYKQCTGFERPRTIKGSAYSVKCGGIFCFADIAKQRASIDGRSRAVARA
jgi:hypothetical protein